MNTPPPHQTTADIGELLPLPKLDGLNEGQIRGAACVWCKGTLDNRTAVDLGARPDPRSSGARWYPRGCLSCAAAAARRAYALHCRVCNTCAQDETACAVRRTLRRLALEGRR